MKIVHVLAYVFAQEITFSIQKDSKTTSKSAFEIGS